MSILTLDNIFKKCLEDRLSINTIHKDKTLINKDDFYKESWNALNLWIENRLIRRKGANIPNLGVFTWELKKENNKILCRPIFLLDNELIKTHKLKSIKITKLPLLATSEDVNYSQLAIKYSNNLTKDIVFCGIRDIIRHIVDYISRFNEFIIEFSFGSLYYKDKRIKFEFNQKRLAEILPESLLSGVFGNDELLNNFNETNIQPSITLNNNFTDRTTSNLSIPKLELPQRAKTSDTTSLTSDNPINFSKSLSDIKFDNQIDRKLNIETNYNEINNQLSDELNNELDTYLDNQVDKQTPTTQLTNNIPENLQILLNSLTNKYTKEDKINKRKQITEIVLEQAYMRAIDNFEKNANESSRFNEINNYKYNEYLANEKLKKKLLLDKMNNLKKSLNIQINEKNIEKIKEKNELMNAQVTCIVDTNTYKETNNNVNKREILANELQNQIKQNNERKNLLNQQILNEEVNYLNHLAMEMDLNHLEDRKKHLDKQKLLLESWERDSHIHNLKKLQTLGINHVREYINKNYQNKFNHTNNNNVSNSAESFNNMSIGFDSRI